MKLYTERQMREMFRMGLNRSVNEDGALYQFAPIELPSDEEIKEQPKYWGRLYKVGFVDGKKWFYQYLHDKIQGGNK